MTSPAFVGVPLTSIHPHRSRSLCRTTRMSSVVMGLRPASSRRAYNSEYDRSPSSNIRNPVDESAYSPTFTTTESNGVTTDDHSLSVEHDGGHGNGIIDNNGNHNNNNNHWRDDEEGNENENETTATELGAVSSEKPTLPNKGSQNWLVKSWPALSNRLSANPKLPIQLGVEISVGFVTKTLAEFQGRGERFWKEFDFYLSDIALEIVGDAMLVWLLSPVALTAAAQTGWLGRLPRHAGQIGSFSLLQRATTFVYKGAQFGCVGFVSSMIGHGATTWMVQQRREKQAKEGLLKDEDNVELAPVVPTSLVWGGFMLTSSNARYQTVNTLEQRLLYPMLGNNAAALTVATFALRFGNCFAGGVQWLPFAKYFNIQ